MKRGNIAYCCTSVMSQILEQPTKQTGESAYVLITCEDGSEEEVMDLLTMTPGIIEIRGTIGSYDILTKVETRSIEELGKTIELFIRKIPKIRTTTTIVCEHISFY